MENKEKITFVVTIIFLFIVASVNTFMLIDTGDRINDLTTNFADEFSNLEKFEGELRQILAKTRNNAVTDNSRMVEFLGDPYCSVNIKDYIVVILFLPDLGAKVWNVKSDDYILYKNRSPNFLARLYQGVSGPIIEFDGGSAIYLPTDFTFNKLGKVTSFFISNIFYELCKST